MTNLIVRAIQILGEPIEEGVVRLTASEVQPVGGTFTVPEYVEQELVLGETTFYNIQPGNAIVQIFWGVGRQVTLRVKIPTGVESVSLADLSLQKYDRDPTIVSKTLDAATRAEEARDTAVEAAGTVAIAETTINQTRDAAVQSVVDTRDSSVTSVESARDTAVTSVNGTRDSALSSITDAGTTAVSTVNSLVAVAEGHADDAAASASEAATSEGNAADSASTSDDAAAVAVAALVAAEQEAQEVRQISEMQFVGEGFPNGVVTAPVGAVYTDTLATSGAVRWIKTSGTGNTGWQVEYGDTGLRRVDDLFPEFDCTTAGHHGVFMRRVGPTVFLFGAGKYVHTASSFGPLLHTVFGRPQPHYLPAIGVAAQAGNPNVRIVGNGSFSTRLNFDAIPKQEGLSTSFHVTYSTANPVWPTTLPGTPA